MRPSLLGLRPLWLVCLGLGAACSNIIGLSDYEIDPDLDRPSDNEGGSGHEGGGPNMGSSAAPNAGSDSDGGEPQGTGGEPQGTAGVGVEVGGQGGMPAAECTPAACDDEIDCTVDTCDDSGACVHMPDSTKCDRDANECIVCKVGLGCVDGDTTTEQLLINPAFDEPIGAEWVEDVDGTFLEAILYIDDFADSPPNSAWFTGVEDPQAASEQGYADLLQDLTIPTNIVGLKLTGKYELLQGTYAPEDDYILAGIYQGTTKLLEFNRWAGDDPETVDWTTFEGSATPTGLARIAGKDVTFDIFGENWDSSFYFDTLSLEATLCSEE